MKPDVVAIKMTKTSQRAAGGNKTASTVTAAKPCKVAGFALPVAGSFSGAMVSFLGGVKAIRRRASNGISRRELRLTAL